MKGKNAVKIKMEYIRDFRKIKNVKKVINFLYSNLLQISEIIIWLLVPMIPLFINTQEIFQDYLRENVLSQENIVFYLAVSYGGIVASVILFIACGIFIRRKNNKVIMNTKYLYHDYSYSWYWFCAKILGIKRCNLILVPIYMQYALVIRSTFEEYPLNDDEFPVIDNEPACKITKFNTRKITKETNLVLEDTYIIQKEQIPEEKRNLTTIKISRNDGKSCGRHFSQTFVESIITEIRKINHISILNIYATTNPMNTKHVAKRVFALDNRGNVDHLYVFQQNEKRIFASKGHKIF